MALILFRTKLCGGKSDDKHLIMIFHTKCCDQNNLWPWTDPRSEQWLHLSRLSFQRSQTDGRTDGQMEAAGQTHVGVYLSTTTGRNTSTAEPGQGPWIWLGQAAIWMARGRKGGIRRNQPANQPNKTTWRMEQLQRGRRGNRGGWRRVGSSWRAACLPSQTPEEISWHDQI